MITWSSYDSSFYSMWNIVRRLHMITYEMSILSFATIVITSVITFMRTSNNNDCSYEVLWHCRKIICYYLSPLGTCKRDRVKSKRNSTIDFTLSAAMHRHTTRKDCLCAGEQEVATKRAFFSSPTTAAGGAKSSRDVKMFKNILVQL